MGQSAAAALELRTPPAVSIDTSPKTEVAPILFTHWGDDCIRGSEQVLLDLLRHLDRRRFPPLLWCNSPALARAVAALGVPAIRSQLTYYFQEESPGFSLRKYCAQVREGIAIVRRHGIRLLHGSSGATSQWLFPVSYFTHRPLVSHLHSDYLRRSRYVFGFHRASLVVGVSRRTVDGVLADGMPPERVAVIYNGIDPDRLGAVPSPAARPFHGATITAVGALTRHKGHDVLIQAAKLLAATNPEARFLIAGDGPERPNLERQVDNLDLRDHVHFLGHRDDVTTIYRDRTDIFALASRAEAFGLAIAEAGYFGLPAVGTCVGGVPEVIEDGVTGFVVPPKDAAALAAALRTLLANPGLRRRMGEAARARILEKFTVTRMVRSFEAQYQRLLLEPSSDAGWREKWNAIRPYLSLLQPRS